MSRSPDSEHPTRPFFSRIENKITSVNRRLRDPGVALGWPKRGPWVTQASPNPKPNQSAEGRKTLPLPLCRPNLTQGHPRRPKILGSFAKYQRASFAAASFVKDRHYNISRSGANLEVYHLFALRSGKTTVVVSGFEGKPFPSVELN
jgi:hypothetical protein